MGGDSISYEDIKAYNALLSLKTFLEQNGSRELQELKAWFKLLSDDDFDFDANCTYCNKQFESSYLEYKVATALYQD